MPVKQTILLVDDEADIRELYKLVLESAGDSVIAVDNAPAALEIMAAQPVDLLITDHQMPEMSGVQLINAVRGKYPGLPTILASGQINVNALAKSCGASAYYRKSAPITQLIDTVKALLKGNTQQHGDAPSSR